jgi:hypothetical protein
MRVSAAAALAGRMILVIGLLTPLTTSSGRPGAPKPQVRTTTSGVVPAAQAARPVDPNPAVGAVFLGDGSLHTCSGAVLHSAAGNLVLTAAHCLVQGVDANFVPGLADKADPQNIWNIEAVYLDPRWVSATDPMADFAIARVGREGGGSIESAVGRAPTLAPAPDPGSVVSVTGYPLGAGGGPIGCRGNTDLADGRYPSVACSGFGDGTSGAPWITGSTVVGLIGGLDGGGCEVDVSYSPPFDEQIILLLARAEAGGPGDASPSALQDTC